MAASSALHRFDTGRVVFDSHFELGPQIGRGSSSVVYQAYRIPGKEVFDQLDVPLAIKVLQGIHKDPAKAIERIKKEAIALKSCIHPAVVRMYEYVAREDMCYISMEYAENGDLSAVLKEGERKLSPEATIKLVLSILEGVRAIHDSGIIHRDLKLENVLLDSKYSIKIADFSTCLLKGEVQTSGKASDIIGTIEYQSPEVLSGLAYTPASDLYSVGIILYRILSGNFPFSGRSFRDSLLQKLRGEYIDLPYSILEEYPGLDHFFKRVFDPKNENRFTTAREMSLALSRCLLRERYVEPTPKKKPVKIDVVEEKLVKNDVAAPSFFGKIIRLLFLLTRRSRSIILAFGILIGFIVPIAYGTSYVANWLPSFKSIEKVVKKVNFKSPLVSKGSSLDSLLSYPSTGKFKSLSGGVKDYSFSILPTKDGSGVFSLGVKGWQGIEIDLKALIKGEPIIVEGQGIRVMLRLDEKQASDFSGTFENLLVGNRGRFEIYLSSK